VARSGAAGRRILLEDDPHTSANTFSEVIRHVRIQLRADCLDLYHKPPARRQRYRRAMRFSESVPVRPADPAYFLTPPPRTCLCEPHTILLGPGLARTLLERS